VNAYTSNNRVTKDTIQAENVYLNQARAQLKAVENVIARKGSTAELKTALMGINTEAPKTLQPIYAPQHIASPLDSAPSFDAWKNGAIAFLDGNGYVDPGIIKGFHDLIDGTEEGMKTIHQDTLATAEGVAKRAGTSLDRVAAQMGFTPSQIQAYRDSKSAPASAPSSLDQMFPPGSLSRNASGTAR
jgi:hypothetical protein